LKRRLIFSALRYKIPRVEWRLFRIGRDTILSVGFYTSAVRKNLQKEYGDKMKKFVALLVAALAMTFVASAQAEVLHINFYSQTPAGTIPTRDVHYTIMDVNSNKVVDDSRINPRGVQVEQELEPGFYQISAEQPSTGYFGSTTVTLNAEAAASESYTQSAEDAGEAPSAGSSVTTVNLVLSDKGLEEVSDSELNNILNPNNTPNTPAEAAPQAPQYPTYPAEPSMPSPYPSSQPNFGRFAGILGAGGLATAIVACFLPERVSK